MDNWKAEMNFLKDAKQVNTQQTLKFKVWGYLFHRRQIHHISTAQNSSALVSVFKLTFNPAEW